MAEIYTAVDSDLWIYDVLRNDPLMVSYCPGGFWAENPPQGTSFPVCRYWIQSPGSDVIIQDGRLTRVESEPRYVICILDLQQGGVPNFLKLNTAAKRIYELMNGRAESFGDHFYLANGIAPYRASQATKQGQYDVMLGYLYQLRVQ